MMDCALELFDSGFLQFPVGVSEETMGDCREDAAGRTSISEMVHPVA